MKIRKCLCPKAFSLIEVTIALAIVATGIIAIIGMIPVGLKASRQAAEHTLTAIILEDVHDRLQGHVLEEGPLMETANGRPGSPFYYDEQGVFIPATGATEEELFRRNYRADVRITAIDTAAVPDFSAGGGPGALQTAASRELLAVVIDLSWPVNPGTGEPMGDDNPKSTISYYATSLTGPEWTDIDPSYQPKIEYRTEDSDLMHLATATTRIQRPRRRPQAFSLVELLIAIAVLSLMMLFLAEITGTVSNTWSTSEKRVESFQSARAALEIMTREMTPAVVDTRMQFAVFPGSQLKEYGAENVVENAPVILWMAPLGEKGDLRCVGYYLFRDDERKFYRLKRILIAGDNEDGFFPQMSQELDPHDPMLRVSPTDALWFTRGWKAAAFDETDPANDKVVASTVADGVIAFWIQCIDILGNPIPWASNSSVHPQTELTYNSAAYFQMATTVPFDNGATFLYLSEETMKGNRVPAAVDITVVTIDTRTLAKGFLIPDQTNIMTSDGALDVRASIEEFNRELIANDIRNARTFTTRVKLVNGS